MRRSQREGLDRFWSLHRRRSSTASIRVAVLERGPLHGRTPGGHGSRGLDRHVRRVRIELVELIDAGGTRCSEERYERTRTAQRCSRRIGRLGGLHHPRREDRRAARVSGPRARPSKPPGCRSRRCRRRTSRSFRRGYEAVNCGDVDGLARGYRPRLELTCLIADGRRPDLPGHEGQDGAGRSRARLGDCRASLTTFASGDTRGRTDLADGIARSGRRGATWVWHVVRFRDGKAIVRGNSSGPRRKPSKPPGCRSIRIAALDEKRCSPRGAGVDASNFLGLECRARNPRQKLLQ